MDTPKMENTFSEIEVPRVSMEHFETTDTLDKEFSLFAMYLNRVDAEKAVETLKKNDFRTDDISLLAPEKNGHRDFVYQQQQSVLLGCGIGAAIGFFALGLAGLVVGARSPEELGMSSWIMTTVVGAVIGLVSGAAFGALVGIGSTKTAGKRYGFYLKEGGIVLSVKVRNEQERLLAVQLLDKSRGQDISVLPESEVWSKIIPEKNKLVTH